MSVLRHRPAEDSARAAFNSPFANNIVSRIVVVAAPETVAEIAEAVTALPLQLHAAGNRTDVFEGMLRDKFDAVIIDTEFCGRRLPAMYAVIEKTQPELLFRTIFLVGSETTIETVRFIDRVDGYKIWRTVGPLELVRIVEVAIGQRRIQA